MFGIVASQINVLPFFHGTIVTPSGLLPSELANQSKQDQMVQSFDGTGAEDRAQ